MLADPLLLGLLACPACGGGISLAEAGETAADGHVMTGCLACADCSASYPIVRGIPRMASLPSEPDVSDTVEGFGYEWSTANPLIQNTRFMAAETFLDFISPVRPDYFADKLVLDGGCGTGRFSLLAQKFGAKAVVAVDLSDAVEVAFENTRALPNVLIAQADIFRLPLRRVFDYAFSIGVLHHTSDPPGAFACIARLVRAGGGMSAWVYAREGNGWIVNLLNPIRRHGTSRLPHRALLVLSYAITALLYLPLRCIVAPVARYRVLHPLKKVLFYFDYLHFMSQFGFHEQAVGIVFDHLVPAIAEYIPREDFAEWFERNGLTDVRISSRAGNSWRGFAVRGATDGPDDG